MKTLQNGHHNWFATDITDFVSIVERGQTVLK